MCLIIMMVIVIKQHLSNIWNSIHEKGKQHWGWVKKKHCFYKKACIVALFVESKSNKLELIQNSVFKTKYLDMDFFISFTFVGK